jgi:hypothetical protein
LIKHPESIQAISLHDQVYKEAFDALNKINQIFTNEYVIDVSQVNKKSPDLLENLKVLEVLTKFYFNFTREYIYSINKNNYRDTLKT